MNTEGSEERESSALPALTDPHIFRYISRFSPGRKLCEWPSVDLAVKNGSPFLLRELLEIRRRKIRERRRSAVASTQRRSKKKNRSCFFAFWSLARDFWADVGKNAEEELDLEEISPALSPKAAVQVASQGNLCCLVLLHEHQERQEEDWEPWPAAVMDAAAAQGHIQILRYLLDNRPAEGCSSKAMELAAAAGQLDVLQLLHSQSQSVPERVVGCTVAAMDNAARAGHLSVVQFLHEQRYEGYTVEALAGAMRNGHWEVVQYLQLHRALDDQESGSKREDEDPEKSKSLSICPLAEGLQRNKAEVAADRSSSGSSPGFLSLPPPLVPVPSLLDIQKTEVAVVSLSPCDNSDRQMAPDQSSRLLTAVREKDLPGVRALLRENESEQLTKELAEDTCVLAAAAGQLDMIQLLSDAQIAVPFLAIEAAVRHGHLKIVYYLLQRLYRENHALTGERLWQLVCLAGERGDLDVLRLLLPFQRGRNARARTFFRRGKRPSGWKRAVEAAALAGRVDCLRYLLAYGGYLSLSLSSSLSLRGSEVWHREVSNKAVAGGSVDVIRCWSAVLKAWRSSSV